MVVRSLHRDGREHTRRALVIRVPVSCLHASASRALLLRGLVLNGNKTPQSLTAEPPSVRDQDYDGLERRFLRR